MIQRHHLTLVRSLRTSVGRREWVRGLTVMTENKERSIFDLMLVDWEEYDCDAADRQMNYEEQEYLKSIEQFNRDKEG